MLITKRAITVTVAGLVAPVLAAAAWAAPAIGGDAPVRGKRAVVAAPRVIGSFTPATADPRLAAAMARAGMGATNLRFTPSAGQVERSRAVTVAVRATRALGGEPGRAAAAPAALGLAAVTYNLGAAVGWKRFAVSGDMTKVDLGTRPGSREAFDLGVSYVGDRASARVKAIADRPLASAPRIAGGELDGYSLDVGGSYSVTRNLAVTGGVRYRLERDRMERLRDERRDSQAVYLGTAFRF